MNTLFELAKALSVQIEYADLTMLGHDGHYRQDTNTVTLQHGMLYRLERSVLAHELAHAHFKDEHSIFAHLNTHHERRADAWAAHHLIDMREYRLAEAKYGTNTEYIARELNVMGYIVEAYERTLSRIGDCVYVAPKMGAGQWDAKVRA